MFNRSLPISRDEMVNLFQETDEEKLLKIYNELVSYFDKVETGYKALKAELEKREHPPTAGLFNLDDSLKRKLETFQSLQNIINEFGALQYYFGWSDVQMQEAYDVVADLQKNCEWEKAGSILIFRTSLKNYGAIAWPVLFHSIKFKWPSNSAIIS